VDSLQFLEASAWTKNDARSRPRCYTEKAPTKAYDEEEGEEPL
jgi:hypothetical protein